MARSARLLVVDPAVVRAEDRGVARVLGDLEGDHRVLRPGLDPRDGPRPGDGYDADGIVILGSRASVRDDADWLARLGAWLDPLLDGGPEIPVLGICFGHQLIAHRAGGAIAPIRLDRSEESGIRETRFSPCRLVPGGGLLRVVASHGEEVKRLPPGLRPVARRDGIEIDAFEHDRRPVFGVQFHPEADETFLRLRGMPVDAREPSAFEDQEALLEAYRRVVLAHRSGR